MPLALTLTASAKSAQLTTVGDDVITKQRAALAVNTKGKGFGPQSPRNIDIKAGTNTIMFEAAPASNHMNLCNIHFHKNAEHAGGAICKVCR